MNDPTELIYGLTTLAQILSEKAGSVSFRETIDACAPGASAYLEVADTNVSTMVLDKTFVTCMSEHDPVSEVDGRLSMWRAYGSGGVPVAIILNLRRMVGVENRVSWPGFVTPVCYKPFAELRGMLHNSISELREAASEFEGVSAKELATAVNTILYSAATSIKHPGFDEEREWRIVYFSALASMPRPEMRSQGWPTSHVTEIGGIPQRVFEVSLTPSDDGPDSRVHIRDVLLQVIVGPTDRAHTVTDAIVNMLDEAGIENGAEKVIASSIPLRH